MCPQIIDIAAVPVEKKSLACQWLACQWLACQWLAQHSSQQSTLSFLGQEMALQSILSLVEWPSSHYTKGYLISLYGTPFDPM